ncbi:putative multidrug resistance protein fnx1 [Xylariomycetidae sp. FL2044]|nr:putative multidrug resistance protein fnx1 [Xylariomycetidae sp. FL2044]
MELQQFDDHHHGQQYDQQHDAQQFDQKQHAQQFHHHDAGSPEEAHALSSELNESKASSDHDAIIYLHGPRFWLIFSSIAILMFLIHLEIPVVTTALVAITNELHGFENSAWVVASYFLGYVGVIVIFAKFSDIFGRKLLLLASGALFVLFSAGAAAAQTMVQLIVCRAFQGMGGGGCYSLITVIITEIVPAEQYTKMVSMISIFTSLGLLVGPIIGGAIAVNTTWRWIFIINVPIGLLACVIAFFALPKGFPYHGRPDPPSRKMKDMMSKKSLDRVDIPGNILILFATVALTAGFEEADGQFPWRSAYVITLLTVAGLLWIVLIIWERYVTLSGGLREPILPWTFLTNRHMVSILLHLAVLGGPIYASYLLIPERFQLVYGLNGLDAGVRLIPFTVMVPLGTIFASSLAGKLKIPIVYIFIAGACLQIVGFALLGTLPTTTTIPARIYGFQVIAGWGCGMNFSLLLVAIPFVTPRADHAVGMGAGSQFRMMGAAIILSIANSVFNTHLRSKLPDILHVPESESLISSAASLAALPIGTRDLVKEVLAQAYNNQMIVLCVCAALEIPVVLLMWKKNLLVV